MCSADVMQENGTCSPRTTAGSRSMIAVPRQAHPDRLRGSRAARDPVEGEAAGAKEGRAVPHARRDRCQSAPFPQAAREGVCRIGRRGVSP